MVKNKEVVIVNKSILKDKIYIIRGQKVMLDKYLAEIYGYSTMAFNQQVQRNIEKFAEDFMFQLTKEEYENLMCNNCTSRPGEDNLMSKKLISNPNKNPSI